MFFLSSYCVCIHIFIWFGWSKFIRISQCKLIWFSFVMSNIHSVLLLHFEQNGIFGCFYCTLWLHQLEYNVNRRKRNSMKIILDYMGRATCCSIQLWLHPSDRIHCLNRNKSNLTPIVGLYIYIHKLCGIFLRLQFPICW